jgi:hypothetical protein
MQGYQQVSTMGDNQQESLSSPVDGTAVHAPYNPTVYETSMTAIGNVMGSICCCLAYQSVNRGEVGLVTQYGRYIESKEEGLHYVNMITQRMQCVDTKRTTHALNKQTVITSDNLQVIFCFNRVSSVWS